MGKRTNDAAPEEYRRRLTTCLAASVALLTTGAVALTWPFWSGLFWASRLVSAGIGMGLDAVWDLDWS